MPREIHQYRPQRTSPESLEAIFVSKEHILEEILGRLGQWQPGASRQHYLLIGPRGIGKTHLLTLIANRISANPDLKEKWHTITFAEESYRVLRIADLLVEALGILAEETENEAVACVYNKIRYDEDDDRVVDLSLDAFRNFHKASGKGILLMVENVDRIFERQIKDRLQIHLFRKILIEEDWLDTICTSPTYLSAVTKEDEPFFEFFKIHFISELSRSEQLEMLQKLAAHEGNKGFQEYLKKYHSRLKALYHFTGGNPRLTIMLYDLVSYHAVMDVQTELDRLLDKITPFYQDRMKDIGQQEGKLVDTMALMPEGCTPTELARESRMEPKTVRAVLSRLEKAGYVKPELRRRKKTVYIIPERLFRIWHQMNHSRSGRGLIRYLLEFFSTWYATKKERDEVWEEILEGFQQGKYKGENDRIEDLTEYMEYVIAVSEGSERYKREFDLVLKLTLPRGRHAVDRKLERLDASYKFDGDYFIHKGYFFANDLGDHKAALGAFRYASWLKPDDIIPLFNQAVALDILGRCDEADSIHSATIKLLTGQKDSKDHSEAQSLLIKMLRDESHYYAVRIAAYLIREVADDKAVDEIISILNNSKESWRRQHCATALGLLENHRVLPSLLGCLHDKANNVRGSAATALGRIGSEKAVEPLIASLNDKANNVRGSAATALGRIGSEKAVEPLIASLNDKANNVRGSAATALGRIGSEKAIEPLIALLNDKANNVRGSAATALGRIGSEKAVEPLIALLNDKAHDVRGSAATALGRIGSEKAVEPLIASLNDKANNVRGSAATALGRIGSEKAVEPLIASLNDKANNVRGSAATALGRIGSEKAIEPLLMLLNDKAHDVRASVTVAFGRIASDKSVKELDKVIIGIKGLLPEVSEKRVRAIIGNFLRAAYLSADLRAIRECMESVKTHFGMHASFYYPYTIALKYLESDRDRAIIERQHPEMRDAVQLLVELFDKRANDTQDRRSE